MFCDLQAATGIYLAQRNNLLFSFRPCLLNTSDSLYILLSSLYTSLYIQRDTPEGLRNLVLLYDREIIIGTM